MPISVVRGRRSFGARILLGSLVGTPPRRAHPRRRVHRYTHQYTPLSLRPEINRIGREAAEDVARIHTKNRSLDTERDACGVGFVAESKGGPSRRVMEAATAACDANEHRGACSADGISGRGRRGWFEALPRRVHNDAVCPTPQLTSEGPLCGAAGGVLLELAC